MSGIGVVISPQSVVVVAGSVGRGFDGGRGVQFGRGRVRRGGPGGWTGRARRSRRRGDVANTGVLTAAVVVVADDLQLGGEHSGFADRVEWWGHSPLT